MAAANPFQKILLFCGIIFREIEYYQQARERLVKEFSPTLKESLAMPFTATDYYFREMGSPLQRRFLLFSDLYCPSCLPAAKHFSNDLEIETALNGRRRVNIDPGFISPANVVIATCKNFAHRVPLQDGIYAHLEYVYRKGAFSTLDWTYPDFHQAEYRDFFKQARSFLLAMLKND